MAQLKEPNLKEVVDEVRGLGTRSSHPLCPSSSFYIDGSFHRSRSHLTLYFTCTQSFAHHNASRICTRRTTDLTPLMEQDLYQDVMQPTVNNSNAIDLSSVTNAMPMDM
jgi:hypothetical protein